MPLLERAKVGGKLIQCNKLSKIKERFKDKATSDNDFGDLFKVFGNDMSNQYDLTVGVAVLAEEGFNTNGCYFKPDLLVSRHHSARLKPFNLDHNASDIIGVMYDSAIMDGDNNFLNTEKSEDKKDLDVYIDEKGQLKFREGIKRGIKIPVACALYNFIKPEEIIDIIEKVENGEEVDVSMELYYSDYQYALEKSDGTVRFLNRSPETEYLDSMINQTMGGERVGKAPLPAGAVFGGIAKVESGAGENSIFISIANSIKKSQDSSIASGDSIFSKRILEDLTSKTNNESASDNFKIDLVNTSSCASEKASSNSGNKMDIQDEKKSLNLTELSQTIANQGITIGELNNKISASKEAEAKLEKIIEDKDKEISKINKENTDKLSELNSQIASLENKNKEISNVVKALTLDNSLLSHFTLDELSNQVASLETSSVENFVNQQKTKREEATKQQKELIRKAAASALGLKEDATEEEIEKIRLEVAALRNNPKPADKLRPSADKNSQTTIKEESSSKDESCHITVISDESGKETVA